jgi:hypothetical protein
MMTEVERKEAKRLYDKARRELKRDELNAKQRIYYLENKDKILAQNKIYYEANKENHAKLTKTWRERNPERFRELVQNWEAKNKDYIRAYKKLYREANNFAVKARIKAWRIANPDKVRASDASRRAAKERATVSWADLDKICELYALAIRLTEETGILHHVDHIVPLRSKLVCGLHNEFNLQVLPWQENLSKGNRYWPDMP